MESNYSFNLVCLDQVTSTNEVLFRAPFAQYPLGTALLARRQTAGRGRADRTWFSNEGGVDVVLNVNHVQEVKLHGDDLKSFQERWISVLDQQLRQVPYELLEYCYHKQILHCRHVAVDLAHYERCDPGHPDRSYEFLYTAV